MIVLRNIIAISALALWLAGCSIGGCAGWAKFQPSRKDKLTEGTERQIISHNVNGERRGCW
jgi:hypothetical protein